MPTLENQVKIAIIVTHGVNNPDPSRLKNDTDIAEFNFNDMQFIKLTERFNSIATMQNPGAKNIKVDEVMSCEKVQDCIDLVKAA